MFKASSLIFAFFIALTSQTIFASMGKEVSFYGKKALTEVANGENIRSVRKGDRSTGKYNYKKGMVSPLVNANKKEETRSYKEQIAANAYGKVQFTGVKVQKFQALSETDQKNLLKFYTKEKLKKSNWDVTILTYKYMK